MVALAALAGTSVPHGLLLPLATATPAHPGILWLPFALGLAASVRWREHVAPIHFLSASAFALAMGLPVTQGLLIAGAGTFSAQGVAWALKQAQFDSRLTRPSDLILWTLAAALHATVCTLSPLLARAALSTELAMQIWLACAAAVVVFAQPLLLEGLNRQSLRTPRLWAVATPLWLWAAVIAAGPALDNSLAVFGFVLPFVLLGGLCAAGHPNLAGVGTLLIFATSLASVHLGRGLWAHWPAGSAFIMVCTQGWMMGLMLALVRSLRSESDRRARHAGQVLDSASLGVAEWLIPQRRSRCSGQWLQWAGEAGQTPLEWLEQVQTDDRAAAESALRELFSGRALSAQLELRVRARDSWTWLELRLMATEVSHDGEVLRLTATVLDISRRREFQERERLSASLFHHLHEGLLITDADLRVVDANPAYSQILGVARHELLGSVPAVLQNTSPDPLARQQRADMWHSLDTQGSWRGEYVERRRSGEVCTLSATVSVIKGPDGRVRNHVLVISDITEARVQRDRLERQANYDELTRLPNRARIQELLACAVNDVEAHGQLLAVCYLDLDRFKPVNDRYGHAAGDRLLAELAARLRSALRTHEASADAAGRLGGDEFVLLLHASTMEEARLAVERVLQVVSQPYVLDDADAPVTVTASLGVTVYPVDRSDADTLLRHADHAMYGAKQAGRNGYQFFDPEHRRRTEERVMAIGRVQEALDQNEFLLYYQPKVDMQRNVVVGLEALLRWNHPQHGLISPLQFVPLIENTGLSARVGDWVLEHALNHLAEWRREGLNLSVSVNVTARHLQAPDFTLRLGELLSRHAEPLGPHLELEVLETAAQADIEATSALILHCRKQGVRFALDDFGTGYSTLNYLKRLPVDVLKIDRSFVSHMLEDTQDRAIVEGIIGLARTFRCSVVAEGLGSPAQARALLEMGCHIGQGSGIATPMPAAAVAGWVREFRGLFALQAAAPTAPALSGPQSAAPLRTPGGR